MSMPQVMEANMRQSCFLKDFSKGMADHTWVKWSTIRMAEHEVTIR